MSSKWLPLGQRQHGEQITITCDREAEIFMAIESEYVRTFIPEGCQGWPVEDFKSDPIRFLFPRTDTWYALFTYKGSEPLKVSFE